LPIFLRGKLCQKPEQYREISVRATTDCAVPGGHEIMAETISGQTPAQSSQPEPRPKEKGSAGRDLDMGAGIPAMMTAIGFDAPGGPEVLRPERVDVPQPGPDEVLIKVGFAGVNRPDVIQRMGHYPPPKGASPIPGLEIAGEVVAMGAGAPAEMLGTNVCALVTGGGYAEYCLAKAAHCLRIPDNLPLAEAAALPETLFTVWHNVFERGWAKDGETLLVHGGTSGIGTMAIMLGKAFDLNVIVTCGSDAKCAEARRIGADLAINYKAQDFVEEVRAFTQGKGVDVVLDMVSGDYVPRNIDCLAEDGRHVTIAVLGGPKATINMGKVMMRRIMLTGSTLRARSDDFKAILADEIYMHAWPMILEGDVRPVMDQTFDLTDAAAAHARMEAGDHIGKIVLKV
jgi:putative PIG3 family NAD(P)H quinone oxidoreductase